MKSKRDPISIQPRFRILQGKEIAMGPGKADLLYQIQKTGSIAKAARQLGMSYMRAWTLIKTMHSCFAKPLVEVSRGGAGHGGAKLTATGKKVLQLYHNLEKNSLLATNSTCKQMAKLMRT